MPFHEDIKIVELLLVIEFLEGVVLFVIRHSIGVNFDVAVSSQLSLECPLAVDEAHVAQIEVLLHADGTAELSQLLLQLKDPVASIDDE